MNSLHLTLLYCVMNVLSSGPVLEYTPSTPAKILRSGLANPATDSVKAETTNIILQSNDGGETWQDISRSLPVSVNPEDFYANDSDLYLRVDNATYHSKTNLKTPDWEKVNDRSIAFNSSGIVESEGVLIGTGQGGIRRSTDNGKHWEWVISEGGVGIAVERI